MSEPSLHPSLEPVGWLVGSWSGEGQGEYPTIDSFGWIDQTWFWHVGKPVLLYEQRTKDVITGEPRHAESGFLRMAGGGEVEFIVAHNTGHAEVSSGQISGRRVELRTESVVGTGSAKNVVELERTIELDGSTLRVALAMAAVGQPMTHHLASDLQRVG